MSYGDVNMAKFEQDFSSIGELLLPSKLAEKLLNEAEARSLREQRHVEAERKRAALCTNSTNRKTSTAAAKSKHANVFQWPAQPGKGFVKIFDRRAVEAYAENLPNADGGEDDARRVKALMTTLLEVGEYRRSTTIGTDWKASLSSLEVKFPLFGDVIDYLRGTFAVAQLGDRTPILQPMLFAGNPGVGKSYFAAAVAKILNTPANTFQMNTMQTSATLGGAASYWSNAAPGLLFKTFVFGGEANPLFVLEEIDKIAQNLPYDPMASLYQIFEPGTATSFRDQCFEWLPIDVSRATIICTANSTESIPGAILSRLKIFQIDCPTQEQTEVMITHIFDELRLSLPAPIRGIELHGDVAALLNTQPPRVVRNVLKEAVGRAVLRGSYEVIECVDVVFPSTTGPKSRIGFLS